MKQVTRCHNLYSRQKRVNKSANYQLNANKQNRNQKQLDGCLSSANAGCYPRTLASRRLATPFRTLYCATALWRTFTVDWSVVGNHLSGCDSTLTRREKETFCLCSELRSLSIAEHNLHLYCLIVINADALAPKGNEAKPFV